VPKGIVAGQQFIANTSLGEKYISWRITVPSGVTSGQLLYITFTQPSAQQPEIKIIDISNEEGFKLKNRWFIKPTDKNEHTKKQSRRVCNQTEDYKKKQKIMSVSKIRQL
jgi:hypothetical protein